MINSTNNSGSVIKQTCLYGKLKAPFYHNQIKLPAGTCGPQQRLCWTVRGGIETDERTENKPVTKPVPKGAHRNGQNQHHFTKLVTNGNNKR